MGKVIELRPGDKRQAFPAFVPIQKVFKSLGLLEAYLRSIVSVSPGKGTGVAVASGGLNLLEHAKKEIVK